MRKWTLIVLWGVACGDATNGGATGAPLDDPARMQLEEARAKRARALCRGYHDITQMVRLEEGHVPASLDDVEGLRLELDPWGGEFRIRREGAKYWIVCNGPDGEADTEDDIRWPRK